MSHSAAKDQQHWYLIHVAENVIGPNGFFRQHSALALLNMRQVPPSSVTASDPTATLARERHRAELALAW